MKLTNAVIYASAEAVDALCRTIKLPAKTFFARAEGFRRLRAAVQDIGTRQQMLLDKYGARDDAGHFVPAEGRAGAFVITDAAAYNTDWQGLLAIEVEIPIERLTLAELGEVSLSIEHMMALDWLVDAKPERSAVS